MGGGSVQLLPHRNFDLKSVMCLDMLFESDTAQITHKTGQMHHFGFLLMGRPCVSFLLTDFVATD